MGWYTDRVLPRLLNRVMDDAEIRGIRQRVCASLQGDVVEVGFGSGLNLPHLPGDVSRLCAVEPSRVALGLAQDRIARATSAVRVIGLDGRRIPLPDRSADAVLCTWTLCTIPDPVAAVAEIRRVLRPGGQMHFVEHGIAPDEEVRRWQRRLDGVQQRIAGGCHLTRDMSDIIRRGGMTISRLDRYYARGRFRPYCAMAEGIAHPNT